MTEAELNFRTIAVRLLELAGKHSDMWSREDYEDYRECRDALRT